MGSTFHGSNPWPHSPKRSARHAAIAYLDLNTPLLLPLRSGDVLVVNAGAAATRALATSPAYYLNKGAAVLSSPTLHAK